MFSFILFVQSIYILKPSVSLSIEMGVLAQLKMLESFSALKARMQQKAFALPYEELTQYMLASLLLSLRNKIAALHIQMQLTIAQIQSIMRTTVLFWAFPLKDLRTTTRAIVLLLERRTQLMMYFMTFRGANMCILNQLD